MSCLDAKESTTNITASEAEPANDPTTKKKKKILPPPSGPPPKTAATSAATVFRSKSPLPPPSTPPPSNSIANTSVSRIRAASNNKASSNGDQKDQKCSPKEKMKSQVPLPIENLPHADSKAELYHQSPITSDFEPMEYTAIHSNISHQSQEKKTNFSNVNGHSVNPSYLSTFNNTKINKADIAQMGTFAGKDSRETANLLNIKSKLEREISTIKPNVIKKSTIDVLKVATTTMSCSHNRGGVERYEEKQMDKERDLSFCNPKRPVGYSSATTWSSSLEEEIFTVKNTNHAEIETKHPRDTNSRMLAHSSTSIENEAYQDPLDGVEEIMCLDAVVDDIESPDTSSVKCKKLFLSVSDDASNSEDTKECDALKSPKQTTISSSESKNYDPEYVNQNEMKEDYKTQEYHDIKESDHEFSQATAKEERIDKIHGSREKAHEKRREKRKVKREENTKPIQVQFFNPKNVPYMPDHLLDFVKRPLECGRGNIVKCFIERNDSGPNKLAPIYTMLLEVNTSSGRPIMYARKKATSRITSHYVISLNKEDLFLSRNMRSHQYLGKLRSSTTLMDYYLYDYGNNPEELDSDCEVNENIRQTIRAELAYIHYQNSKRSQQQRKMEVVIPAIVANGSTYMDWRPLTRDQTMEEHFKAITATGGQNVVSSPNFIFLHKRETKYDPLSSCIVDFRSRATCVSVKNFQLIHSEPIDDKHKEEYRQQHPLHIYEDQGTVSLPLEHVILQFGKVGRDCFNVDFQYPLSMLQAFAISLSRFDTKQR